MRLLERLRRLLGPPAPRVPAPGEDAAAWLARLAQTGSPLWAALIARAPFGLALCGRDGRLVAANEVFGGLAAPGAALAGASLIGLVAAEDEAEVAEGMAAVLRGLVPDSQHSIRFRRDPESEVSLTLSPVLDPAGARAGIAVRAADVTEPRRLQRQLAESAKLQAVGQLAGGLAHDFNNLLTAVMGATDLMLARGLLDETDRADLVHVRRAAERGAGLVRQLLAFSRRQTLRPQVIDLSVAIEDLAPLLRRLLGQAISLELDLDRRGRLVRADPMQLDQVVLNLAANARDAMPAGGALVVRSSHLTLLRPLAVGAETVPPGRYLVLEVSDSGHGIAPEHMARIFEPFFTTKGSGGTGLGLATAYGIVRQTEGYITVESEPGRGTSFRIYLPRYEGAAAAAAPRAAAAVLAEATLPAAPAGVAPGAGTSRGTVLLAEDEEPVRELVRRVLVGAGWQVLAAASGEEALARLEVAPDEERRSLVALVSDVAMPGMDGPELARRLRLRRPDLPVILVSGYAETARLAAVPGPPPVLLPKPFALRALVEAVARLPAPVAAA